MKSTAPQRSANWFGLLLKLPTSGVSCPKQAIYLDPTFSTGSPNEITFLPAVDIKSGQIYRYYDNWKSDRGAGSKYLQRNGIRSIWLNSFGELTVITRRGSQVQWSASIHTMAQPPESATCLVIALLWWFRSTLTFWKYGNAEIAGFLYDRDVRLIVWRDKVSGRLAWVD